MEQLAGGCVPAADPTGKNLRTIVLGSAINSSSPSTLDHTEFSVLEVSAVPLFGLGLFGLTFVRRRRDA